MNASGTKRQRRTTGSGVVALIGLAAGGQSDDDRVQEVFRGHLSAVCLRVGLVGRGSCITAPRVNRAPKTAGRGALTNQGAMR